MAAAGIYVAARQYEAPGPLPRDEDVVVPRGGLAETGQVLATQGVVANKLFFQIAAAATFAEGPIRAAEFNFPAHASLHTVLTVLRTGRPVQHRVTIPEGHTAAQVAEALAGAEAMDGEVPVPPEGRFLPDTYSFNRGSDAAAMLARGAAAMARELAAAWAGRASGLPLRSPEEALILASIVEREAKLPAERPMIARVFLNRLARGMRLQADPTAAYGAAGGLGHLDRPLTHADLERVDDYNTYVVPALPSAPICNPGIASIRAVFHPADGNALYFVSDGSGGHLFTDRLAVHDVNVGHLRGVRR